MIHEASVILHGGYGPVTGLGYLYLVLLYLLAFAVVAMFFHWCFDVFEAITAESASEQDIEESGADRERGQESNPLSTKRSSDDPEAGG